MKVKIILTGNKGKEKKIIDTMLMNVPEELARLNFILSEANYFKLGLGEEVKCGDYYIIVHKPKRNE